MTKITFNAALTVVGGPSLQLGGVIEPESYAMSTLTLAAKDDAANEDEGELDLLPHSSPLVALGVRARTTEDGKPADVSIFPLEDGTAGDEIEVDGTLVVVNQHVIEKFVAVTGVRKLRFVNKGAKPISVDVLTAFKLPPD